jgi:hypothetical protein
VTNTLAYYEMAAIMAEKSFLGSAPGACTIKLFTVVIVAMMKYAIEFATAIYLYPSLIFTGKAESHFRGAHCYTPL